MKDLVTYETGDTILRALRRLRQGGSVSEVRDEIARVGNDTYQWRTVQAHLARLVRWRLVDLENGRYVARKLE